MDKIGRYFRLTTFGESHGRAIGGIIEGCPSSIVIDTQHIENELRRRATSMSAVASQRHEPDEVEFLSGLTGMTTLGTPIAFMVKNRDANKQDYSELSHLYRPSHADYTYQMKYGVRDPNGGGRASARTSLPIVVAGAIAKQILARKGIEIQAYTRQIGNVVVDSPIGTYDYAKVLESPVFCPDPEVGVKMIGLLEELSVEGDTTGGVVSCCIRNVPAGIGEPMFDKVQSCLAYAMMSIPSAKGFEYGGGFASAAMLGSQNNDAFVVKGGDIVTQTNHSGGIQGGITNGADITFNVAFKPISSIKKRQVTVSDKGERVEFSITGRHDVCAVPRAVVIVESLAAITILDLVLVDTARQKLL